MAGTRDNGIDLVLAQPRGFCAGVVRAVEVVERALARDDGRPVYVRHAIVHNGRVVADLEARGARFVERLDEVPDGAVTIFSAHGVARAVEAEASRRGLPVIDATCPLVAKVHRQGQLYAAQGRTVVLIGHAGHAEVEGTLGRIDGAVHLVGSVAQAEALDLPADAKLAYVTQTTLSVDDTRAIVAVLHRRFPDLVGPETRDICYATQNRQAAVRALAAVADLILVVGARTSSKLQPPARGRGRGRAAEPPRRGGRGPGGGGSRRDPHARADRRRLDARGLDRRGDCCAAASHPRADLQFAGHCRGRELPASVEFGPQ